MKHISSGAAVQWCAAGWCVLVNDAHSNNGWVDHVELHLKGFLMCLMASVQSSKQSQQLSCKAHHRQQQ
jgi:hypothetical protein